MKAYGQLNSEAELMTSPDDRVPPVEWPDKGIIELQNVKFKYAADYPYVLKSITFKLHSGEKVCEMHACIHLLMDVLLGWYCG